MAKQGRELFHDNVVFFDQDEKRLYIMNKNKKREYLIIIESHGFVVDSIKE